MNLSKIRKVSLAIFGAFLIGLVSLGIGSRTASAGVEREDWVPVGVPVPYASENTCEPGTNPIALVGSVHRVWYWTPEGTLIMRHNGQLTGTDGDGTEYIANYRQTMVHPEWPVVMPYTNKWVTQLISKGSTVNALIVRTYDSTAVPPLITVTACVGGQ